MLHLRRYYVSRGDPPSSTPGQSATSQTRIVLQRITIRKLKPKGAVAQVSALARAEENEETL